MARKIIYLSGPISGRPEEETKALFAAAEQAARDYFRTANGEPVVMNPLKMSEAFPGLDYEAYMSLDLELLTHCNIIVLLPGWPESEGCKREFNWARINNLSAFVWSAKDGMTYIQTWVPSEVTE